MAIGADLAVHVLSLFPSTNGTAFPSYPIDRDSRDRPLESGGGLTFRTPRGERVYARADIRGICAEFNRVTLWSTTVEKKGEIRSIDNK